MKYSSKLIEQAVESFATLPGIGRKTALRLVLHLIKQEPEATEQFAEALSKMRQQIKTCTRCHNISDELVCHICQDKLRDQQLICVVETIRDVMAIEDTGQFRGQYHVLGGVISPIEGIGPTDLNIDTLVDRVKVQQVNEVILAISPTIEGDTTAFYLAKQLNGLSVQISNIARGVSFGGELEYADELTLARSISGRIPYQSGNGSGS